MGSNHGRIVKSSKYSLSPNFTSYVVEYEDGFREGQIKVYEPLTLSRLIALLRSKGIGFTYDLLKSPPEPRGVMGYLVKFDFDDVTGTTLVLEEGVK